MRHGMELGADDYLPKPFSLDGLYGAVEARLKKAEAVRQAAQKHLEDLRANISLMLPHEMRTPLNGILAYGEMLSARAVSLPPEEVAEMGQVIYDSGKRLERLIENFLIYAQIEMLSADAQRLDRLGAQITRSPAKLVAEHAQAQAHWASRTADLLLDLADSPMGMSAAYLAKIVDELVQNAFKFSLPGSAVSVRLFLVPQGPCLTITDHGRGFSPDQIGRIGAYMQFDRKLHEQQGLGLGLVIAKRLVELHGGALTISSEPGVATTVTLELPKR
jgi:signal transduction histidine kinase